MYRVCLKKMGTRGRSLSGPHSEFQNETLSQKNQNEQIKYTVLVTVLIAVTVKYLKKNQFKGQFIWAHWCKSRQSITMESPRCVS